MSEEIAFVKYERSGPYHWAQISRSLRGHNAFVAERYAAVLRAAQPLDRRRVLDLGCGDGALSYLLARQGARVTGLDVTIAGLVLARGELGRHGTRVPLVLGSGYALPFSEESFDAVVCSDVIEHVRSPGTLLHEMRRVLAPGGRVILTTPSRLSEKPFDPLHAHEFYPGELGAVLEQLYRDVRIAASHPVAVTELYRWRPPPLRRPLLRYLINVLSILGWNPFRAAGFRHYEQIIATGVKGPASGDAAPADG